MKIKTALFATIPLLFLGCSVPMYVTTQPAEPQPVVDTYPEGATETNYQVFYDQLGPYGNWVDSPDYGYVWHPNVDADFRPYATNGHWLYSDQGWTWVSNYNWGWAPFHYGTWFFDDNYGWLWVPGHDWAPAWVTWGRSGDYYCWAPLAPNADVDRWTPPQRSWNFAPSKRITRPDLDKYVVNNDFTSHQRVTIINNISNVDNYNGNRRGNGGDNHGSNTISIGANTNNGRGGTDNNRGNNNPSNNNGNNYNRGNDNGRNNNNPPANNNGNNNYPNNNGNSGRNNNNPSNNNNPNNNAQPVNSRPNNPNAPGYNGNNANNNQPNTPRPASSITVPDNNTGVNNRTGNNQTTNNNPPTNNGKYNRGPAVNQVENATNDRVPQRTIQEKNQPGPPTVTNTTVTVFKPRVQPDRQNPNGQRPAPKQVQPYKPKAQN